MMRSSINDAGMLEAVQPAALTTYAQSMGWRRSKEYRDHSDIYEAVGRPEIILPRTKNLTDYARVVSQLIDIFASEADIDQLSIYREMIVANRDVIRVRIADHAGGANVTVTDGANLMQGAREMILAAACSLKSPRPLFRTGAHLEANEYLNRMRLGPLEQGSFVLAIHSPAIAPSLQSGSEIGDKGDDPPERMVTRRLAGALKAAREATDFAIRGESDVFRAAVSQGVSANLCDSLVMLIGSFASMDTSISWARTRPVDVGREVVHFGSSDVPILSEASRTLRSKAPQPDALVIGMVQKLSRGELEIYGTVSLRAYIDDSIRSVVTLLNQSDYDLAIRAHQIDAPLVLTGDLERVGQRWRLLNPQVLGIIDDEEESEP